MTSNPAAFEDAPLPAPTPSASGNSMARDAALFLGLGILAAVVCLVLAHWIGDLDILTFSVVCAAAWLCLTLIGVYKLSRAERAGVDNAWTSVATAIAALNLISVLILSCIYVIPDIMTDSGVTSKAALIGLIPLADFALALGWLARPVRWRAARRINLAQFPACLLGLSILCLAYRTAIVVDSVSTTNAFDGHWDTQYLAPFGAGCATATGWLAVLFYALTLRQLFSLRRAGTRGTALGWVLAGAWLQLSALLTAGAFAYLEEGDALGAAIGAVVSALVAILLATLISRAWRPQASRVLRYAVAIPVFCALLAYVPLAFGIFLAAGSYTNLWEYGGYETHPCTWYAPEVLRSPVVHWMSLANRSVKEYANWAGLKTTEEYKQAALRGNAIAFLNWGLREPDAVLKLSLAVPPTISGSHIPVVVYEFAAGATLAGLASDAEILERLDGRYPARLVDGVLWYFSMHPKDPRSAKFHDALKQYYFTQPPDGLSMRHLGQIDPTLYRQYMDTLLKANPIDYTKLCSATQGLSGGGPGIAYRLLTSNDSVIRTLALLNLGFVGHFNLKTILDCASGKLQGATPNEQRAAGGALDRALYRAARPNFNIIGVITGAPTTPGLPLSPAEIKDLNDLIKEVNDKLHP